MTRSFSSGSGCSAGVVEVAELEALDQAVEKIVADAVRFAEESPKQDPSTLAQFVYADPITVH